MKDTLEGPRERPKGRIPPPTQFGEGTHIPNARNPSSLTSLARMIVGANRLRDLLLATLRMVGFQARVAYWLLRLGL